MRTSASGVLSNSRMVAGSSMYTVVAWLRKSLLETNATSKCCSAAVSAAASSGPSSNSGIVGVVDARFFRVRSRWPAA
jgi:hypothetical protein